MTKTAFLAVALALTACGCPEIIAGTPDAAGGDAGIPYDGATDDAPTYDAGADAGDGGLPDAGLPDSGPLEDAGIDAGSDAGGLPDAGEPDSGPPPELDAGVDAGPPPDPDAGPPPEPDAGPPPPVDAGTDAGPPDAGPPDSGPPDAGYDAGPPPCLLDAWEPNNTQAAASFLMTATTNAVIANIDAPTFSGPDSDWYRIDVRRTTSSPTHVHAYAPAGASAWLRIRYVCAGTPVSCGTGSRSGSACESIGLGDVEMTVTCPDLSAAATYYVEATRPSLSACAYSPTLELDPG